MGSSLFAQVWFNNGSPDGFRVYQTTQSHALKQVHSTPFTIHGYSQLTSIDLDASPVSHNYLGCGISLTDASCYLLSQMPPSLRDSVLRDIFTPAGLNLSMVRLNCGASDYATELYNYDDTPDDVAMKHFCIDRDKYYMIPLIKEVLSVQPSLILSIAQPDPELVCIAFRNPDGRKVVSVAYGGSRKERKRVQIKNNDKYLALCLPLGTWSLTTIVID